MKFTSYIYTLLGVLCLYACSDEDNNGVASSDSNGVVFSANIGEYQTRIATDGGSWAKGDRIGTYMYAAGTENLMTFSNNVPYTCQNEEQLATFKADKPLMFPADGQEVSFKAYYPYVENINEYLYPLVLDNQQQGTAPYDLMYAVSDGTHARTREESSSMVPLNFSHCLAKVILKLTDKEEKPLQADGEPIFQGMKTHVTLNLKSGNLSAQTATAPIQAFLNTDENSIEAIVFPGELTDNCVAEFSIDGKAYSWMFKDNTAGLTSLEAGYKYVFSLKILTESGTIDGAADVEQSGSSSTPWQNETTTGIATASQYKLYPCDKGAFADTELKITFTGETPRLGASGSIRIYRADNPAEPIDEIRMDERQEPISENGGTKFNTWMDVIGSSDRKLIVNYHAVKVDGNEVIIKPHSRKLDFDTDYFVLIDKEAIQHDGFKGITTSKWFFTTRPEPEVKTTVSVSHTDANADFYTLQGAVDFFTRNAVEGEKTIMLDEGKFEEIVNIRNLSNLTVKGAEADKTEIQSDNNNNWNPGIKDGCDSGLADALKPGMDIPYVDGRNQGGGRAGVLIAGKADKIRFEDVGMRCLYTTKTQAEVLCIRNKSDNATAFVRCRFYSQQDTLLPGGGYNWFYDCYVEGDTDFIWGGNSACLFESCEVEMITSGGRGFNARVKANNIGYVFSDCILTVAEGVTKCRLLEGSDGTGMVDNITFVNTTIDKEFFSGGINSEDKSMVPIAGYDDNIIRYNKNKDEIGELGEDTGIKDGCKMYDCTYDDGKSVQESGVYGADRIHTLTLEEYNRYFKDRSTVLGGYADTTWFTE